MREQIVITGLLDMLRSFVSLINNIYNPKLLNWCHGNNWYIAK